MTEQPTALRLADALAQMDQAAAELRRLHGLELEAECKKAEAQRDALLGVLRTIKDTKRLARSGALLRKGWCVWQMPPSRR